MFEAIFARIRRMYDTPHMQNNLRGQWVEAMIAEILGPGWRHTGGDWAAWDFEREDGLRLEVKQSAQGQSWGKSTSSPRFGIAAAQGHYPDGKAYLPNALGKRFADIYVFAWHEGGQGILQLLRILLGTVELEGIGERPPGFRADLAPTGCVACGCG